MSPAVGALAVALWAASVGVPAPAPGVQGLLLDRIVAVVDNQTVSQAELAAEARLALARRAQVPEASARVVLDAPMLHDFLSYLIGQMLVAREARRVGAQEVHQADVDAAYEAFAASFASAAALDVWSHETAVSPAFVRDVLRREQTVERYLGQRLRTRLAGLASSGDDDNDAAKERRNALRAFLPGYLAELRQTVEVRRLTPSGALEREPRP